MLVKQLFSSLFEQLFFFFLSSPWLKMTLQKLSQDERSNVFHTAICECHKEMPLQGLIRDKTSLRGGWPHCGQSCPAGEAGTRRDPDGVQGMPRMGNFLRHTIWQTIIRKYCEKQPNRRSCLGNQLTGTMWDILCLEEKWHKIHHIHITQKDKLNDGD